MKNYLLVCGVAATLSPAALAGIEIGDTLELIHIDANPSRAITYDYDGSRAWDAPSTNADGTFGQAGINNFEFCQGFGNLQAFCVEVSEGFNDGCLQYDVVPFGDVPEEVPPGPMNLNASKMVLIQDLYSKNYASTMDGSGSIQDWANRAAAFQLVVWEISHENIDGSDVSTGMMELNLELGAFQVVDFYNAEVMDLAQAMIDGLGVGGFGVMSNLLGLHSETNQDMLIVVPSPAIAGLAGLGLVGLRRRRR